MMDRIPGLAEDKPKELDLEAVMETYQHVLLRYATRVLKNEDAAQDVVQEAFIRLHENWNKVMVQGVPLKGWLFRTTHNASVDYIRKESRLRLLHERQAKAPDLRSGGESDCNERQTLVLQHLNALSSREREVLVLRMQEGMSYRQIADVLKRSEGYVGTLIHTATKKLTQSLRKAGVVS
jgi:RNA polymerase sigma-70 factor (ECF subfamily)